MQQLGNALSLISMAIKTRKQHVTISNTKAGITFCKKLFQLGYISGFFVLNAQTLMVIIKTYKDVSVVTNLKSYYHAGNNKFYTLYRLKQQLRNSTLSGTATRAFVSTSKGILTDKECYMNTISGLLLSEIY